MPKFRYLAEYPRIYVDRALQVEPGDVVEWDDAPADGQWEPVDPPGTDGQPATGPEDRDAPAGEQNVETGDEPDTPPDVDSDADDAASQPAVPPADRTPSASEKSPRRATPAQKTKE